MFSHTTMRRWLAGTAAAGCLLLAVACSSNPNSPGVASLGGATTTTTAASSGSDSEYQNALQFSACMRQHGVSKFPDPTVSDGGKRIQLSLGQGSGIDSNSATFRAAQQACQKYMSAGGTPKGGPALDLTKVAPWAACMRKHGLPNFPDPVPDNGALKLNFQGSGIDPNSTTFQNAMQACRSLQPGGGLEVMAGPGPGNPSAGVH